MPETNYEQRIQQNQEIIAAIDGSVVGLKSLYDHFDGSWAISCINDLEITEAEDFEYYAKGLKDDYLPYELKQQYNKFIAMLIQYRKLSHTQLNDDLIVSQQKLK